MSPGGPAGPDGHGDNDPPERSLRKDGSLTQERSLRVSSSDDSISLQACREERDEEEEEKEVGIEGGMGGGERHAEQWGKGKKEGQKKGGGRRIVGKREKKEL